LKFVEKKLRSLNYCFKFSTKCTRNAHFYLQCTYFKIIKISSKPFQTRSKTFIHGELINLTHNSISFFRNISWKEKIWTTTFCSTNKSLKQQCHNHWQSKKCLKQQNTFSINFTLDFEFFQRKKKRKLFLFSHILLWHFYENLWHTE
jgi:hypothetical protein